MISQWTKVALAQAKARGTRLGNPRPLDALKLADAATAHLKPLPELTKLVAGLRNEQRASTCRDNAEKR